MKFKIGDKVRYINNNILNLKDKIGTIYYIDNSSIPYEVIWENWNKGHSGTANDLSENHFWCLEEELELVNHEYKVGDLVLLKNKRGNGWAVDGSMDKYIGAKVRIKSIEKYHLDDYDYFYIENDTREYIFRTTDIEKIINEPEIQIFYPNNINDIILEQSIKEMKRKPAEKLLSEKTGINLKYMEEKEMEILKIYRNKTENYLRNEYNKKKEEILNKDRIQSVLKRAEEEINILLERDEDNKFEFHSITMLEPATEVLLKKVEKEFDEKINKFNDLVTEVKAQMEIAENYETKIEILKRYNILDETGKIVDPEKENNCCCELKVDGKSIKEEIEKTRKILKKRK